MKKFTLPAIFDKKNIKKFTLPAKFGQREIIGLAVILLVVAIILCFLIKLEITSLKKSSRELLEKKASLTEVKKLINNQEAYEEEIRLLEERIKSYESKLPEQEEVSELFRELDRIAAESQIKFIKVEEGLSETEQHYHRFYWKLQLEGGYHELKRFINKLENLDRFIRVDNISISTNSENFLRHKINLEVSTFVSKR